MITVPDTCRLSRFRGCFVVALVAALLGVDGGACRRKRSMSFKHVRIRLKNTFGKRECNRLYGVLDEKSRWAAISLVRDAKRIAGLVREHYPAERQDRALARVHEPATATDARKWIALFCVRAKLTEEFADLGRTPRKIRAGKKKGVLISSTGRKVTCLRDAYGNWGCDMLRNRLEAMQVRMANLLKVTEENVAFFRKGKR